MTLVSKLHDKWYKFSPLKSSGQIWKLETHSWQRQRFSIPTDPSTFTLACLLDSTTVKPSKNYQNLYTTKVSLPYPHPAQAVCLSTVQWTELLWVYFLYKIWAMNIVIIMLWTMNMDIMAQNIMKPWILLYKGPNMILGLVCVWMGKSVLIPDLNNVPAQSWGTNLALLYATSILSVCREPATSQCGQSPSWRLFPSCQCPPPFPWVAAKIPGVCHPSLSGWASVGMRPFSPNEADTRVGNEGWRRREGGKEEEWAGH